MASDDIKIRLKAFLDSSGAQKDIDSFVDKNQKKPIDVKVNVDIDANDSQQKIQSTINKIRGHNAIRFPVEIDTKGMSDAFQSFNQQIENYERKIKDAGGIIKKMDIAPHFETAVWDDGEEHIEKTYKALITYQTAVGETIQQIITLNTATGEISETTGKMSVDFEKQRKDFTQLASAVESYTAKLNALKEKSRAILGGTADTNSFKALIDSIDFSKVGNIDELDAMVAKLKQAQAEFDRLNASITNKKLAGTSIEQINQNLERIPDRIAEIRSRFSDIQMPDTIRQQLEAVEQQLENIRNIEAPDQFIAAYNQITQVLDTIPSKLKVIQAEQKQMTQNALEQQRAQDRLNSLIARYQASATRYSAFKSDSSLLTEYRALGNTIEQLQQRLQQVKQTGVWDKSLTADIASANAQMSQFNNHVVMAGKNAKSLKDTFKEAFSTFGTWLSATSIIMKLIQGIRNAITAVKDLDAAMVNLKKVTNETDQAYTEYLKNVGKQAQRIGATMTDLIESGATFAKLGYSFKESQGLAEVATIFANVGDFNNINTATNGLITAMKSFNIAADDAMSIADKINEVANRFAVSADDLTTGLANSASALNLAGNTIDQTIAMITAMSEITQNASESGNALKILSMRLRGAKAELQSAGEETDGMCESTAKLREKILALTDGVDIMADEAGTQFKSTYQIMQEIAAVWNDLTDINQAALLETIAGKLRGNSISALLTNMAQANKVLETSLDSAGSALSEHEKWLESIAAKEAQMKAAWQDFADTMIETGAVKAWYDGLTGILNVLTAIVDKIGALPTLLGGLATFFSVKGGWLGTARDSAGNVVGRIGQYTMGSGFSFSKLFNGEVNVDIINQYTEALNNGASAADAMKQAVTDASGQVLNLNGATRQALASQTGAATAMQQLGIATTATTGKMIAQTVAVKALNVALNIGIMALVSLAASAIAKGIQAITENLDRQANAAKYLKEELSSLQEEYSDTQTELSAVNDELETTQNRMAELQNAKSLSFVEQDELKQLQLTNAELKAKAENLAIIAEYQQEQAARKATEAYQTEFNGPLTREAQEALGKDYPNIPLYHGKTYDPIFGKDITLGDIDTKNQYIDQLLRIIQTYGDSSKPEQIERVRAAKAYLASVRSDLEGYAEIEGLSTDLVTEINARIDQIDSIINPGGYKTRKFEAVNEKYKEQVALIQELASGENLHLGTFNALNPFFIKYIEELQQYGIEIQDVIDYFNAAQNAAEELTNSLTFETVQNAYLGVAEAQEKLAEISQKQGYAMSITEEQYKEISALGEEYAKCVENVNGYVALNIDKVNELVQAKYEEQKATIAANKAQAQEKYAENAEAIRIKRETLKLLDNEYYRTHDGYADWVKQLQNGIAVLESDNSRISEEIAGYERLASQLEYATSAYKKWLDAQNAPEAGEAYDNLRTAMEQIKEGQESGKIGTAKYKAAVELLVPDGRDVDSYMKTLGRYLTEDSTGLQNFIDDMYKRANPFLSKDASGKYSFMKGVTVEDIAQGLGLTNEVAQYMLTALKDYGWDVDLVDNKYTSTDTIQQYQDAIDAVKAAQEELNALIAKGASTEQIEAAKQKVEELEQALDEIEAPEIELTLEEQLQAKIAEIQAMINEMEALNIPIAGVITSYTNGDGVDPNSLVSALAAIVLSYTNAGGTNPNTLVGALSAYVTAYSNGAGGNPNALVSTLSALISSYGNSTGVDPNTLTSALTAVVTSFSKTGDPNALVNALSAVVTAFGNGSGVDPNILVNSLSALVSAYGNATGIDPNNLVSGLSAIISDYASAPQKDPNALVAALQAYVSSYNNKTGVDPNSLVSGLSADVNVGITDNATAAIHEIESGDYQATVKVDIDPDSENGLQLVMQKWAGPGYVEPTEPPLMTVEELNGLTEKYQQMVADAQRQDRLQGYQNDPNNLLNAYDTAAEKVAAFNEEVKRTGGNAEAAVQNLGSSMDEIADLLAEVGIQRTVEEYARITAQYAHDEPVIHMNVDTSEAENSVDELVEKAESAWEQLPNNFQKVDAFEQELFNTRDIDQAIANLGTTWEKVRDAYTGLAEDMPFMDKGITPTINEEEFKNQLEEIYQLHYDGPTFGLNADPSNALKTANNAKTQIGNMTATMTINGKYGSILGGLLGGYTKLAKGTHFAREEDAIVGESGIETWIHDGKFYTVGHNGAELVHLSRGDQVLNPGETRALFKGKRISGNAYAEGTGGTNILGSLISAGANLVSGIVNGVKNLFGNANNSQTKVGGGGNDLGGGKNNNNNNGGGKSKKQLDEEYLKSLEDLVDWIPTALENLKKKTDEYIDYADKAVGYMLKNSNLDNAIKNISDEISLNMQGYERYMQQANEIAQRMNLSGDIISKIQNGTIDIESYDEDTRKVITAYQKWYDLAVDCRDAVSDLRDQQSALAKQKLDNITKYYENRITLLGTVYDSYQKQIDKKIASGKEVVKSDYSDMITNTQEQIDMLQQERDTLSNELQSLVDAGAIQEGSDDWYEYTNQIKEFDNTIADAQISMEGLKDSINGITLTNIQTAMSMLNQVHSTIQGFMDLRSAQGKTATAGDYRDLISSGSKQIKNLEMQNAALLEQQEGLDVLSEKYQEIQKQINENALAILSTKAKQEEWNDAIIDLEIERLQKQNTQYKSQLQLMDAIESLEKAKQRRALVYREGRGFDYEAISDDVDSAQRTLDDLLFEQALQQLEDSKIDSNIYDDYGNELTPIVDTLPGLDFSSYYGSILNGNERSGLLSGNLSNLDISRLIASGAAANELSVTIEEGAISLSGVNNVNELAEAITNQLPNALLQELYKN